MSEDLCPICHEAMDTNRAICNHCGREFHLALRIDSDARDCGDAWIDDVMQALIFGCNSCLGRVPKQAEPRKRVRRAGVRASAVARMRGRARGAGR